MNLSLAIPVVFSVFALSGCTVPNDSPIRFLNAHSFKGTTQASCTPDTIAIYRGSLDIAGSDRYYTTFEYESVFQQISTAAASDTVAGPQRNEFVMEEIVFNYSSTPPLSFSTQRVNAYAVATPGASGSWLGIHLITPEAAQVLRGSLGRGDSVELLVTFYANGRLASGQKLSSNKVTYPIGVRRSSFLGCRLGDIPVPSGPCGTPGGQDGTIVACCSDYKTSGDGGVKPPDGCPTA